MNIRVGALPCPTADTESLPCLVTQGDTATLSFRDWQNRAWRVDFHDVLGASYDVRIPDGLADDQSYEVLDSAWISELCAHAGCDGDGLRHFAICFNEGGGLCINIVFRRFAVTAPSGEPVGPAGA